MADPSQMFNVPTQVEGPLAGYMRGIMGDYGMQQQNQLATQRDILNQRDQLTLEQLQKDVPLQDLTRQNAMSTGQNTADAWGPGGSMSAVAEAARQKAIAESSTIMTASQVAATNAKQDWWTNASAVRKSGMSN
jgi:uncharacterized linocin/CFP29 family protein